MYQEVIPIHFQERLYLLRKQAGLSQEGLADIIGVSRQAVQKWETGAASPDLSNLAALCDYFEVTMDYLVRGEDMPKAPAHIPFRADYEYTSKRTFMGLPLVHIHLGYGLRRAKGIIAIGNIATGVVAIGGMSAGIFSLGGLSLGIFALGGVSLGALVAFGGVAFSLLLSLGGIACSLGNALGGLAIAGRNAFGGLAVSEQVAIGGRAIGGLALSQEELTSMGSEEAVRQILAAYPNTPQWVLTLARLLS